MITYTNRSVWPVDSTPDDEPALIAPSLTDIAVGLGRQVRFAGQTRLFYTVLCHSVVASIIAREYDGPRLGQLMLLHDAHEAILGDTPTTWKSDATRSLERELDERIYRDLGVAAPDEDERAQIHVIDAACLAAEAHVLGHAQADKWWPMEDFGKLELAAGHGACALLEDDAPRRLLRPQSAINLMQEAWAACSQ